MLVSIALILLLITNLISAHMTMMFPLPRSHPLAKHFGLSDEEIDFECIMGPLNKGRGCPKKELKFPCGGYKSSEKVVTKLKAGQVFDVSFFNQNFNDSIFFDETEKRFFVNKEIFDKKHKKDNQARHNGGTCEFSLSYDNGKTFTKIATYHKTCPDMAYNWTVKIPNDAPSGKSIFSWSWLSSSIGSQEFYQNCADVIIIGDNSKNSSSIKLIDNITRANLPGVFNKTKNIIGEHRRCKSDKDEDSSLPRRAFCNASGAGPRKEDIEANLNTFNFDVNKKRKSKSKMENKKKKAKLLKLLDNNRKKCSEVSQTNSNTIFRCAFDNKRKSQIFACDFSDSNNTVVTLVAKCGANLVCNSNNTDLGGASCAKSKKKSNIISDLAIMEKAIKKIQKEKLTAQCFNNGKTILNENSQFFGFGENFQTIGKCEGDEICENNNNTFGITCNSVH